MSDQSNYRILPVIMSGGAGSRLWPLSRQAFPKQFLPLAGKRSLVVETLSRVAGDPGFLSPLVIASDEHRFIVAEQLRSAGIAPEAIVLEPVGRNTAPAAAVAAHYAAKLGDDVLVLLMPADHVIRNAKALLETILTAAPAALDDRIAVFGVTPTSPDTGYGYIQVGKPVTGIPGVSVVKAFEEKPDSVTAEGYLAAGDRLWNAGIFLFSPAVFLEELERLQPAIAKGGAKCLAAARADLDFLRLDPASHTTMPSIAIDYAVMEHTKKAVVAPLASDWSDIGSWDALWALAEHDPDGNAEVGHALTIDTKGCYLHSDDDRLIATLGVEDLIVVTTVDAVMVANRKRSQDVRKIVDRLKAARRSEADFHHRVFRPWGHYESVNRGSRHQVKQITVYPGAKLSLQKHYHRAEHWVVVSGTALVTRDKEEIMLHENQSIYLPQGCVHRLANPGKVPLQIIEVQSGSYLEEDDIVRLEDTYGRV